MDWANIVKGVTKRVKTPNSPGDTRTNERNRGVESSGNKNDNPNDSQIPSARGYQTPYLA
jgi:hypothetical protein